MNVITLISLRNLLRQKRRNFLLGLAIAFGVMILVVANSFSNGITDILFNKIIVRIAGHISVAFNENGGLHRTIFRDKDRMISIVKKNIDNLLEIEEGLGVFSRVIGKGKADNLIMVALDLNQSLSEETKKDIEESFKMITGDFLDLNKKGVENPVILSEEKAKALNIKKNDIIRSRFTNIFGNNETARLTVVGIVKNSNVFMQAVMFASLNNVKRLMGFKEHEIANLNITLKNPKKNALKVAEKLHSLLKSDLGIIYGLLKHKDNTDYVTILGIKTDTESNNILKEHIKILDDYKKNFSKSKVLINQFLSKKLGIKPGDTVEIIYENKFDNKKTKVKYFVDSIFYNESINNKNVILLDEKVFYNTYYFNLPKNISTYKDAFIPAINNPLYNIFSTEWALLDRTETTDQLRKKMKDISRKRWKATTVDVRTMYESASDVLKLENVLQLITFSAVLILFFIILIGVINTIRMTVRERTREIGTIRAIGMQKKDVRNTFLLESFFLAFFASIIGIIMAFGIIKLLSLMTFDLSDNPLSILLINGHLYFKPTFTGIFSYFLLILFIVFVTAYFPSKKAANLSPSTALRQYE